jgi:hypothetical protein
LADTGRARVSAWRSNKSEPTDEARIEAVADRGESWVTECAEGSVGLPTCSARSVRGSAFEFCHRGIEVVVVGCARGPRSRLIRFPEARARPDCESDIATRWSMTRRGWSRHQLYAMLFSGLGPNIQAKKDWLLSLDEGLYDVAVRLARTAGCSAHRVPLTAQHLLGRALGAIARASETPASWALETQFITPPMRAGADHALRTQRSSRDWSYGPEVRRPPAPGHRTRSQPCCSRRFQSKCSRS